MLSLLGKFLWEEIGKCSVKVIIFIDFVGYEKYLWIIVFGLLLFSFNYCLFMVVVNNGFVGMSKEYFGFVLVFNVLVMVVVIKIDICFFNIFEEIIM